MEMQEQNDDYKEGTGDNYDVEIYSRRAIFWFSLIFSPIFGGIMLTLNLRWAGYRKEAMNVLVFSVLYYLGQTYALGLFKLPLMYVGLISLVFNAIGAAVLVLYFFKKYFPEEDYYPKSIIQPMIIAVVLLLVNYAFMSSQMPQLMNK